MSVSTEAHCGPSPAAHRPGFRNVRSGLAGSELTIEVPDDLRTIEVAWRDLERTGFLTPFQRFDFVRCWYEAACPRRGAKPAPLVVRDEEGTVLAIFPFQIVPGRLLTRIEYAGGTHSNSNVPLLRSPEDSARLRSGLRSLLQRYSRHVGGDVLAFVNQPAEWAGVANPMMALGAQRAANDSMGARLVEPFEAFLAGRFSKDALRDMRRKEKRLREGQTLAVRKAEDAPTADRFLSAYLDQKADFFRRSAISDPFAEPGIREFLACCATSGIETGNAPLELFALLADDEIVATQGVIRSAGHASGMFTAYRFDHPTARYSPGGYLMREVLKGLSLEGCRSIDLGPGEGRYKADYCDETIMLFGTYIGMTPAGRIHARLASATAAIKRSARRNPHAYALALRARRLLDGRGRALLGDVKAASADDAV